MAKEQVKSEWYENFVDGIKAVQVQSVLEIVQRISELEASDSDDFVVVDREIDELRLTAEEEQRIFEQLGSDMKKKDDSVPKYVKDKLTRKVRLLKNRTNRAISEGFGSYIRYLRESKGYSLQDLQRKTEISPSYINRIEKGERKAPSYPIIEKLANALEVDISELLKLAGISGDTNLTSVTSFAQMVYSNSFTIGGKLVSNKQKEALVELVTKISESKWEESTKVAESIQIMDKINVFKLEK